MSAMLQGNPWDDAAAAALAQERLDYFMAHAPMPPPKWFYPRMRECPLAPSRAALNDEQREAIDRLEYMGDEQYPLRGWAEAWCAIADTAATAQDAWQQEFRRELLFQWPRAWADEMMQRSKA